MMSRDMQGELSAKELELLKRIAGEGHSSLKKAEEKNVALHLSQLGLVSLKKGCKATYVITEHGKREAGNTLPVDPSSINQMINELKDTLRGYHDDLKLYIDHRLNEQSEIFLRRLDTDRKEIGEDTFLSAVRTEYLKLSKTSPMAPYVPIGQLREFVCRVLNSDRRTFDTMLLSIANKDPHTVQLSTSSGERGTGIIYGRGECHAAIIK